jgi:hypothetical protein
MEDIYLTNTASVFSNYLDHPERLALAYGALLNLKVNKWSYYLWVDTKAKPPCSIFKR